VFGDGGRFASGGRYTSIDDFRGLAVFLMFTANFVVLFAADPPLLLNHARPDGFLPLDLVAPLFGLAIGLCLPLTLARARTRAGAGGGGRHALQRVVRRAAVLFVIGYVPNFWFGYAAEASLWENAARTWGILETWALAYVLAFILCHLRLDLRLAAALASALFYQAFLLPLPAVADTARSLVEGGPLAVLSWSVIIVAGTVCGELLYRAPRPVFLRRGLGVGLVLTALGLVSHWLLAPLDRILVTASYTVFGAGVAALVFVWFESRRPAWGAFFRRAGQYPLTAWVLQSLAYGPVLFTVGFGHFAWPLAGVMALAGAVLLLVLTPVAQRAGLRLKV
jgi:predicted acyltransferase